MDQRTNLALGFLRVAYNDYIAARVLLNKGYTLQGATLASTAIEKSFKAAIVLFTGKRPNIHMDKFDKIKKEVVDMGYEVLIDKMDPKFIDILCKVYSLRYYDNVREPFTLGFFRNQFIGELDHAMAVFEQLFQLSGQNGEKVLTPLKMDLKNANPNLLENNWVAAKMDRKKFMETNCVGFAIFIHPDNLFSEINVSSAKLPVPYDGSMMMIVIKEDAKEVNPSVEES
jgi:hypothetical protein